MNIFINKFYEIFMYLFLLRSKQSDCEFILRIKNIPFKVAQPCSI